MATICVASHTMGQMKDVFKLDYILYIYIYIYIYRIINLFFLYVQFENALVSLLFPPIRGAIKGRDFTLIN